jgi:FkbM family methyltransferase
MRQVVASLPDGKKFAFFVHTGPDQFVSARITARGSWEPFETRIMVSLLRLGDVFIDIGANIGWYTAVAGLIVGPQGRVFAFEPENDNADVVDRNVAVNSLYNVKLFRCALSDATGTVKFIKSASNLGDHRIASGAGIENAIEVPMDTLDHLVALHGLDLGRTRIVKIDTQGAELMVFSGARNTFAGLPESCAMFVEFSPNLLRKHTPDSPEGFIRMLDFLSRDVFVVNTRFRTIHPIGLDELRDFAAKSEGFFEDLGLDLILAPRGNSDLQRFNRFYGPLVKRISLRRKIY